MTSFESPAVDGWPVQFTNLKYSQLRERRGHLHFSWAPFGAPGSLKVDAEGSRRGALSFPRQEPQIDGKNHKLVRRGTAPRVLEHRANIRHDFSTEVSQCHHYFHPFRCNWCGEHRGSKPSSADQAARNQPPILDRLNAMISGAKAPGLRTSLPQWSGFAMRR